MRILWLTIDRSNRVASHIFTGLQKEVANLVKVDFITRKLDMLTIGFTKKVFKNGLKTKPLVEPTIANKYDFIFTDALFAYMDEPWTKIHKPKGILIEDQHGPEVRKWVSTAFNDFKFNIFCVRYKEPTKILHKQIKNPLWVPHSIDPNLFNDFNKPRIYDVVLIGITVGYYYPFRFAALQKLKEKKYFKIVNRPIETIKHKPKWPTGKDYVELLNQTKITITCTSIYKYPVIKFFEIPACGSVIFSDFIPELAELGFVPDKNILVSDKANIDKNIEEKLKDKNLLQEVAKNGYNLIHSKHTSKIRAKEFISALRERL